MQQDEFDMVRGVIGSVVGHLQHLVDLVEPQSPAWDEVMAIISSLVDLPLLIEVTE